MIILREGKILSGLQDMIDFLPGGIMVEVGTFSGESTIEFAKKFHCVYAIDPWSDSIVVLAGTPMSEVESVFDERIKSYTNIIKMKTTGNEGVKKFEDYSLDFVYIDAMHDYYSVKNDITMWINKVKRSGYIAGHDYDVSSPGCIQAVDEIFGANNIKVFEDSSWLKKIED